MLRVTLIHLALFLLPFVVYIVWIMFRQKVSAKLALQQGPIYWLGAIGLLLVLISLFVIATFQEAPSGSSYTPAEFRDGVLIPGGYDKQTD